jgi:riboflavin biosynthesis pyrimidine reductase
MDTPIVRLYPGPVQERPLRGTYLAQNVHRLGSAAAPFVYANFLSSLDGRIALVEPDSPKPESDPGHLPASLTNGNDFRLFLELQAQADCLITHGGYLRAVAAGRLDDILQVGLRDETRDLAEWRRDNGLAPQPAVVIASASLDFPLADSLSRHGQRVFVATGSETRSTRLDEFEAGGCEIIRAGTGTWVEGGALTRALGERGFRSLYLLTGPHMLETMLRDRCLSRLYLTLAHCIVGGERFHSLISGPELGPAGRLRLAELYYDASAPEGAGQCFAQFTPRYLAG